MVGKWDEVIESVLKNMVTVVRAQTGAGKTTEIPLAWTA
jgi:HrpA-like RNA helicase